MEPLYSRGTFYTLNNIHGIQTKFKQFHHSPPTTSYQKYQAFLIIRELSSPPHYFYFLVPLLSRLSGTLPRWLANFQSSHPSPFSLLFFFNRYLSTYSWSLTIQIWDSIKEVVLVRYKDFRVRIYRHTLIYTQLSILYFIHNKPTLLPHFIHLPRFSLRLLLRFLLLTTHYHQTTKLPPDITSNISSWYIFLSYNYSRQLIITPITQYNPQFLLHNSFRKTQHIIIVLFFCL